MSYLMNGKELWCRPARTAWRPPVQGDVDTTDDNAERLAILRNAAQLVADGIRAGLVQRPRPDDLPPLRVDRPNVHFTCDTCGEVSQRGRSSTMSTCLPCRLPRGTCKACGREYRRERMRQVVCGNECKARLVGIQAAERKAKRPNVPCMVCGQPHPLRFAGGKQTQTCGEKCQRQLQRQIQNKTT